MSFQQGKDTALAYLKVVIYMVNEHMDELDLGWSRPMRLDDLDHLTSYQMMKIIMFLLNNVVGDKPIYKPSALTQFNQFGAGTASYDSGIDHIYHAVKQIFPEDCDLFHYSVLLLPASIHDLAKMLTEENQIFPTDTKRTRAVISYIMSFVLMCDNLEERFKTCFNEIVKENEEKVALCAEVDDLKDKISAKIQERETEKERLPMFQRELENLENSIRKQQKLLAKLNADVEKHKANYDRYEVETKNLEQELERIDLERRVTEQQIVSYPKEIRAENEAIKKQLNTESKIREAIGLELEKCRKDCEVFETLMQRAHHVIQSFESVIILMENTKQKIEYYTKTGNEMNIASKKMERQRQELHQLSLRHGEKLEKIDGMKRECERILEDVRKEMTYATERIKIIGNDIESENGETYKIHCSIEEVNQEIEKLKLGLQEIHYFIWEIIPEKTRREEAEVEELMELLQKEFNIFPKLDIKSKKIDKRK